MNLAETCFCVATIRTFFLPSCPFIRGGPTPLEAAPHPLPTLAGKTLMTLFCVFATEAVFRPPHPPRLMVNTHVMDVHPTLHKPKFKHI